MEQNNILRLLSLVGFLAFAGVSVWATAESLHLLLSSWPVVLCWIVSFGFFIMASLGTKLIVDSLNQNIYKTIIPRNVRLAEAPSYGLPINYYDSKSTGAESYRLLAEEVVHKGDETWQ